MKRYVIADLAVDMEVSGRTEQQAAAYAVPANGPADITLTCDARRVLELNPMMLTEDMAEYMGTGVIFGRELLEFNGTYIHASAVILDGAAYLFSAPSGTGKSTHTEKWCRLFGARYLNDDKPALRFTGNGWMAYGTPWSGKNDLSSPVGVPLGGIACLRRGQENTIRRLDPPEALPMLMAQSMWKLATQDKMDKQLAIMDKLLQEIPVWELKCRNDDEAAWVSRNAMTGQTQIPKEEG